MHQATTIISLYGIWVHVPHHSSLPQIYLCVLFGVISLSTLVLAAIVFYRNALFRDKMPRGEILNNKGAVFLRVDLSRPIQVEAGQYVSLWVFMPSTSFRSLFEYHPFMVSNWSDGPLNSLELAIEPRSGFTRHLLNRSVKRKEPCRVIFSGPHGKSVPVGAYQVVLMVATGFGVAAQLPYLKQLLHECNTRKARSRRIHLVWQLNTVGI